MRKNKFSITLSGANEHQLLIRDEGRSATLDKALQRYFWIVDMETPRILGLIGCSQINDNFQWMCDTLDEFIPLDPDSIVTKLKRANCNLVKHAECKDHLAFIARIDTLDNTEKTILCDIIEKTLWDVHKGG